MAHPFVVFYGKVYLYETLIAYNPTKNGFIDLEFHLLGASTLSMVPRDTRI
jgi:hypothetical protein